MNFQFAHPGALWLLVPVCTWIVWLARASDVQISPARRWAACGVRLLVAAAIVLALAEIQFL
ncbi:MAG TPA: hypothetical protein VHI52_22365, partial [Verrucomicrobiae bacterium]|nr:hypothetical protein [Verrucomicrobiae bacterium]